MSSDREVLAAEHRFFAALSERDREGLERVVGHDLLLIDVMTGSEVPGDVFVQLVASQRLVFDSIERLEARVRVYGTSAIVTGRTRMTGHFEAQPFRVHSRYTHVYVHGLDGWLLVAAQGTPVTEAGPS
jgi:ketosteroid isomerase-like protein